MFTNKQRFVNYSEMQCLTVAEINILILFDMILQST